ncbi:MAG TPA: hypothetical protein VIO61_12870 [Anaerolineaceae bacterium]
MNILRVIAFIVAAILIIFGVLFILSAFSVNTVNPFGNIITGVILVIISFGLIWFGMRKPKTSGDTTNVTVKVDLPGNVRMDSIKCKSCGGVLSEDNIKLVSGAPVVTCPYCKTVYQLTEEPKW